MHTLPYKEIFSPFNTKHTDANKDKDATPPNTTVVAQDSEHPNKDLNPLSSVLKRRQSWLDEFLPEETWIDSIKATSNYLANFDWERSFWQPTNSSQSMHVLSTQGRDGSRGVAQLWIVGQLEFAALEMRKTDYWMVRICISDTDRGKLRTSLKTTGILGDAWSTNSIEPVISVSARPDFVQSRIDLMPDNDSKAKTVHMYENNIFPFIYDVKNTTPGEFPDPGLCDVSNFRPETKVAVELQVHSRNFKIKGKEKNIGYSFKLIGLYKLQEVKILPPSTPEKRRKEANEFIATPPRTKTTRSGLNPLEWKVNKNVTK